MINGYFPLIKLLLLENVIAHNSAGEEEWLVMESLASDLPIADVMKEFNLKPIDAELKALDKLHAKARQ